MERTSVESPDSSRDAHRRMMRKEITTEEYVAIVKEDVDKRLGIDRDTRLKLVESSAPRSIGQKALDLFRKAR